MRILVTGGCGFIGTNLIRFLIKEKGETVINFDALTYAANVSALADLEVHPEYTFVKGNISDANALCELFKRYQPDAVIHLAAESHVDRSIASPDVFIQTNVTGTYNLLQAALEYFEKEAHEGFRYLQVSTDEVYGSLELEAPAFTEDSPYRPNSPYAASKAAADHLVRSWHKTYGLPTMITCCGNNYGPHQHAEKLIPKVIACCKKQEPIPVYGDGSNIRDWIHVDDHAEALYAVLQKGRIGETYNIGARNELQNIELVRMICQMMDDIFPGRHPHEERIKFVPDRAGHDLRYALDTTKIESIFTFTYERALAEGLGVLIV
jgi:dTDP-glucose 4,6-dehydratase